MNRYIDADKLYERMQDICTCYEEGVEVKEEALSMVYDFPTADVEEVKHGKWEHGREVHREYIGDALLAIYYDEWWCSQCHYTIDDHHYSKITYKRCPECGARMNGGENGTI